MERHLRSQSEPDVVVLSDVQHRFGPGFDKPCPDVSVVRGIRDLRLLGESFDIRKMGVRPCLVIEVVSPKSARIREVDERDKVRLYERAGIPEYLLVRLPLEGTEERFQLWGYRLGLTDGTGRLRRTRKGASFPSRPAFSSGSPWRVTGSTSSTPRPAGLRTPTEEEEARKAAEEEVAWLRAELERLRVPVAEGCADPAAIAHAGVVRATGPLRPLEACRRGRAGLSLYHARLASVSGG